MRMTLAKEHAVPSPRVWGEGARRADEGRLQCLSPGFSLSQQAGRGKSRKLGLLVVTVILLLGIALPAFAIDPLPFQTDAQRERFQHLTAQLRCMVCQNESLEDSNADLARDLRGEIFRMMQQGKSDDEIKRYLVARYSDFVLYDPPLKPATVLLWLGPPALLVIGGIVVGVLLRRRVRPAAAIAPAESGDDW